MQKETAGRDICIQQTMSSVIHRPVLREFSVVLAAPTARLPQCLRFSDLVPGMHLDGPVANSAAMDDCFMATPTTGPARIAAVPALLRISQECTLRERNNDGYFRTFAFASFVAGYFSHLRSE
jgi:hypothetical protein